MGYLISYVCVSHIGFLRKTNQDNFLCGKKFLPPEHNGTPSPLQGRVKPGRNALFGIFDGMGGGSKGEVASYLAAKAASLTRIGLRPLEALLDFCHRANHAVQDFNDSFAIGNMGTTATVLSFTSSHVRVCHLGDSRAYRLRDGQLTRLTRDQVLSGCTAGKAPLSQYLGMAPEEGALEPFLAEVPLQPEDIYLLCSDGLTDMLTDDEIRRILSTVPFPSAAEHLLNTALCRGGRDNITLVLCKNQEFTRKPMCIKRLFPKCIV